MGKDYLFETEGFEVFYPGKWTARERPWLESFYAENEALNNRKPFDVKDLVSGKLNDMIGYVGTLHITEDLIKYFADLYMPSNPIFHDAEYCRNKLGLKDIMAYPSIACHDDSFHKTCDARARDMMFVSDFNQTNTFLKPIYPGDTLYYVQDSRHVLDITPETGSVFRTLGIRSAGTVYNQNGEAVSKMDWRMHENFKTFTNGMPEDVRPWLEVKKGEPHVYTDEDYARFIDIWKKEKPRGDMPLYWEDVQIGDQPNPTLDGPIVYGTHPVFERSLRYGMGLGGHRPLKEEVIDPEKRKHLLRHPEYGFFYKTYPAENGEGNEAFAPNGMNFTKRDFAIAHLYNWMGNYGWIRQIRWAVLPGDTDLSPRIPRDPEDPRFLKDVPAVEADNCNGFTKPHDMILVRSYVLEKTIVDREHRVRLAWWVTGVTGDITFSGEATVVLPSKKEQ